MESISLWLQPDGRFGAVGDREQEQGEEVLEEDGGLLEPFSENYTLYLLAHQGQEERRVGQLIGLGGSTLNIFVE